MCNPAGGVSLRLADVLKFIRAHNQGETKGGLLHAATFRRIHTKLEQGGTPIFAFDHEWPVTGRAIAHNGSNGRNYAHLVCFPDKQAGMIYAANVAPIPAAAGFKLFNLAKSSAFPKDWPSPSFAPPLVRGKSIEGEGLEVHDITGGAIELQNWPSNSGGGQLWWHRAKSGEKLTLRFKVPASGNYRVTGVFGGNKDFGKVRSSLGRAVHEFDFNNSKLDWGEFVVAETYLEAGIHTLVFEALNSSGANGIVCHVALDVLIFDKIG